jgi:hypothetical protein
VDLGAERLIAAERNLEKIAVEVKSFLAASTIYEFHLVVKGVNKTGVKNR